MTVGVGLAGRCSSSRGGGRTWRARLRAIFPASVQNAEAVYSAPDDHLTARPNCRVRVSLIGHIVVLVAVQVFVPGLYRPPVFK